GRRGAELSQAPASGVYAAVCAGGAGEVTVDSQWEAGPQSLAGTRGAARGGSVCGAADADGRVAGGNLGGNATRGADRCSRQFLRAGGTFTSGYPGDSTGAQSAED